MLTVGYKGGAHPGILRWAVGSLCALTGALMLVAPHQFAGPAYTLFQQHLDVWALVFLGSGAGLLVVAVFDPPRPAAAILHLLAGGILLLLAVGCLRTGSWTGVVVYSVLSAVTIVVPLLRSAAGASIGLFEVVMALSAIGSGVLLMAIPDRLASPLLAPPLPYLSAYGAGFVLTGSALLAGLLAPRRMAVIAPIAQVALGLVYLGWVASGALPQRIWTGLLYYGGYGTLLILLPVMGPRLRRADPRSLRARLALALAISAAAPLLLLAALDTSREEQGVLAQTLEHQQAAASALAANLSGDLRDQQNAVLQLAEEIGTRPPAEVNLSDLDPVVLVTGQRSLPGAAPIGVYDAGGQVVVSIGVPPLPAAAGNDVFEAVRQTGKTAVVLAVDVHAAPSSAAPSSAAPSSAAPSSAAPSSASPSSASPSSAAQFNTQQDANQRDADARLLVAAPLRDNGNRFAGAVIAETRPADLARLLERGVPRDSTATAVVDGTGRVVIAFDSMHLMSAGVVGRQIGEPLASIGQQEEADQGSVRVRDANLDDLVAYARLADPAWTVLVVRPAESALTTVRAGRDLTFGVLLAAFLIAAILGAVLAERLAAPLAVLARAAETLTPGSLGTALPQSRVTEVRRLADAFAGLQRRLVRQTAARERATARLRLLAEASGALAQSIEEGPLVQTLGRLVVPALADWCTVDAVGADETLRRVVMGHRDAAQGGLVEELRRLPPGPGPAADLTHPFLGGYPLLATRVDARTFVALGVSADERRVLEALGLRSAIVVPLRARGHMLGTLSLMSSQPGRQYDANDLTLAEDLAARAALAIDNARLFAAERQARADAESAVRLRDEFLSVAAHELKTPITSLRGFAQLAVRALDTEGALTPELARQALGAIDRQSGRMSGLIANLLEVARMATGQSQIEQRSFDLVGLLSAVIEAAHVRFGPERVVLCGAPASVPAFGDPLRIEQVFTNLVDNAVKFSPGGRPVEITIERAAGCSTVAIRDFGPGIPAEHRTRVFERYYQAHAGEHTSGMGLGLFISHQIVARHGGQLRAEFPEDSGTRMIVTLPAG
ncbi:MAG: GAF domain-containing protein [Chloroflexi bacterium]|nr:GAF domain-containing protein [Chloroflexota bacterium]